MRCSSGAKTSGCIGQILNTSNTLDFIDKLSYKQFKGYSVFPVKKVFIPKFIGSQRSIETSTIFDRVV